MKKLYLAAMLLGIAGGVIASELKVSAYRFEEKTVAAQAPFSQQS